MSTRLQTGSVQPTPGPLPASAGSLAIQRLTQINKNEALDFLSGRPLHTVYLASLIRDNGLVSGFNRGSFFAYRNETGALEGVALLGHATLIETASERCIRAFAELAKNRPPSHLIRGEQQKVELFWSYYADETQTPRRRSGEVLLELKTIPHSCEAVAGLRQATLGDLEAIATVNASMAFDESGVNPLTRDPQGFRERTARRIAAGRVWVWIENRRLLYKTDIVAETPEAIYIEGVYVDPQNRTKGYGLRCLSQLGSVMLGRAKRICLSVNEKAAGPQDFYRRAGYEQVSRYQSIYLDN